MARSRAGTTEASANGQAGPFAARTRPAWMGASTPTDDNPAARYRWMGRGRAPWRRPLPSGQAAGAGAGEVTIQDTPKRSATMPKREAKKAGPIGICT